MLESPCYDRLTQTDCPDRTEGCSTHCDRWKKYERLRNATYEKKNRERELDLDYDDLRHRCFARGAKRKYGRR